MTVAQRRRRLVRRHCLAGDADGPEGAARALVALHATDPASVYLSVLARCAAASLFDVSDALYTRRSLVRWMAMRRTLFVLAVDDVPMVQAAVSTPLAHVLRRRLLGQLEHNGTDPPVLGDRDVWLRGLEARIEEALARRTTATGAELSTDVPELRTSIHVRAPSDRPQKVTTSLLTLMGTEGRIVRGTPTGPWTSRHHRWEPATRWWPTGLPVRGAEDSERELAHRWLTRFGPATVDDLQWWTGWTKTTTRRALHGLALEEVDLHGVPGIALPQDEGDNEDDEADGPPEPVATLLPALDPTPMGWRHRDWFLGIDRQEIFDRAGNIGPTVWWDGEVVGSWAAVSAGEVVTRLRVDRGADAARAVEVAAQQLSGRIGGTQVTPAARTPLERTIT